MSTGSRSEERMTSVTQPPVEMAVAGPDPSWRGLYRAGGIAAVLYVILGVIVPAVLVFATQYDFEMQGAAFLEFIASHHLYFIALQTLVLGPGILAVVVFVTLFIALKHLNKSYAALGATVAITMQILFVAYYPVLLGLVQLSDQYAAATGAQQSAIATAAEALMAQNAAFNPLYESVFAVSILIISLVMLKGVFHRSIAYLGIASCVAAFVAMALWPVVGVAYFWWWIFLIVWFIAVGWKLFKLGTA
jgi:hypothetical protein